MLLVSSIFQSLFCDCVSGLGDPSWHPVLEFCCLRELTVRDFVLSRYSESDLQC